MRRILIAGMAALVLVGTQVSASGADAPVRERSAWAPPTVDPVKWKTGEIGAVAYDSTVRKVYVGSHYQPKRMNLLVFDVAEDGTISTAPRRYADHPEAIPAGHWSAVQCMLLDPNHHKLFLGLNTSLVSSGTPGPAGLLVMYNLDAQGEPSGPPEAFDTGNPMRVCQGLALHPTLKRLYACGWGYGGVSALNLDDSGRPTGKPVVFPVGYYGKLSVSIRPRGFRIYLGTYPATIEVCDLDAAGNVLPNAPRHVVVPGGPKDYLPCTVNARGIYFIEPANCLQYVELDGKGDPKGDPVKVSAIPVQAVSASGDDRIIVAEAHSFKDAVNGKTCIDGVQLRELAVKADGAPGDTLRTSTPWSRQSLAALATNPGVVLAGKPMGAQFLGNRFAGLMLRATLVSLESASDLLPLRTTISFGKPDTYLSYVYSPARSTVYSVLGDSVIVCRIKKDSTAKPIAVPCPAAVGPVTIDDAHGRLYVAKKDGAVSVFLLQADGTITDTGKPLVTGLSPIALLRTNPQTHQLYVFSTQPGKAREVAGVQVVPVLSSYYQVDAVVDTQQARIYGVSNYNGNENVWVWKLAVNGAVLPDKPQVYSDGLNGGAKKLRSLTGSVKVDGKRHRLYTVANLEQATGKGQIVVYKLDDQGDPVGGPRLYPSRNATGTPNSLELSRDGQWLYESGPGDEKIYVHKLDAAGDLTDTVNAWPGSYYGKTCITMTADDRLLLGAYPSQLEIIRLQSDGRPVSAVSVSWELDKQKVDLGMLASGETTPWVNLDDGLKDGIGIGVGRVTLGGGPVRKATLKFEVVEAESNSQKPLAAMSVNLEGNLAALFLPRYGTDEVEKLPELIQTTDMRFKQYLGYALPWALKPEERPKHFVVANGLILMDSSRAALNYGLETLAALGHNTAQIWIGNLPPETIHAEALRNGITRFRGAVYNPPSYFAFVKSMVTPDYLDKWTLEQDKSLAGQGAKPDEVALYHIADEPGWYYPAEYAELKAKPEYLAVFRDYLKARGMTPELLGKTSWDQVLPIGRSSAKTLADKRLFYWTMRFFPDSLSQSFAAATQAFQRRYHPGIFTGTNLNNWPGRYVINTPNTKFANNSDTSADAGMGAPDWFNLGRHKGVTALWTEDWFSDGDAQYWSLYADLMRCAAREGGVEFGGYVVGQTLGAMENGEGGKYKIMALMGHGAKGLDPYIFGPNAAFADGWSENSSPNYNTYQALAAGIRMLGRSEPLTWPGRPRNGTVAILFPQASQVWDGSYNLPMYQQELYGLHAALIHKQYPTDFVDDTDVEEGALQKYGYATLYVTAPNLSAKAQQAILDWVKAGGTLVLFPGAGMADEYNEPLPTLAVAAGATWENYTRVVMPPIGEFQKLPVSDLKVTDASANAKGDKTIFQTAPMALTGATALAQFANGKPAWAQIAQGRGHIFSFGYWPGSSYWNSPDRSEHVTWACGTLPTGWSADGREIITTPARLAGAKKYVGASADLVEGALLESDKGIAVTLLNWSGEMQKNLTVTIAVSEKIAAAAKSGKLKVESLEQGALKYELAGSDLKTILPLKTVDVLMIHPGE